MPTGSGGAKVSARCFIIVSNRIFTPEANRSKANGNARIIKPIQTTGSGNRHVTDPEFRSSGLKIRCLFIVIDKVEANNTLRLYWVSVIILSSNISNGAEFCRQKAARH
ncbi:hypothetical protein M404DRAFT_30287 [Pisolithus tinctorius Marx 270]|uniref:Uncharacterized protein n=1 Tax=Pisolithus tinctorius Marx 270 TaxID=870435 RepID=A0A0C3IRT6_PISTI|nr:hypothetical protein M404DRAFT_30287 [Pisolithus tinctorius Marx 270]